MITKVVIEQHKNKRLNIAQIQTRLIYIFNFLNLI